MIRKLTLLSVACLLLVWLSGTCFAAETTYQITESQLTQLDQNLEQLSTNNQQLLLQLNQSKQDLTTVSSQLETLKAQLVTLQLQTQLALQQQQTAQASLQTANASFEILEKVEKAKIRKLTLERDISILATIALAFRH